MPLTVPKGPPSFEDICCALRIYRELHGHYQFAANYKIAEDDAKYDESVRGMPLGRLVDQIIRRGLYAEHEKEFEQMGISIAELRRTQVDKVCAAIRCYQQLFGAAASVPVDYVVPNGSTAYPESLWGLRLGQFVMHIDRGDLFREYHDVLLAAGVPMPRSASTGDFAKEIKTVESLLPVYRDVFHHSCVLPSFTVPRIAPWPLQWYNHPLGKDVELLRQNRDTLSAEAVQRLSEVGMVWSMDEFTVDQIVRALKTYKALRKSLDISSQYTVQFGYQVWDRDLWGMRLGSAVRDILFYDKFRAYRSRFESLGMSFDHCDVSRYTFDMVKQALETYQTINDTLDVAASYVIDRADAAYAENLRGMNLGHIVARIREQAMFVEHAKELEAMGFPFKSKNQLEAEQICEGVRCFRRLFGDRISISYSYVIPKDTEAFPRDLWGFPLGQKVYNVRKRGVLQHYLSLFREVGLESSLLPYEGFFAYEMKVVFTLLPVFRRRYGHGCVLKHFKVPATGGWPKQWHGYPLGSDISILRKSRTMMLVADQTRLEKEGMVWSPRDFGVDQVRRGIATFKSMHKNVLIPKSFVIPAGDTQWDRDLWGLRLGGAVYGIRHNGHMKEYRREFIALGLEIEEVALELSHPFELVCEALKAYEAQCGTFKVHRRFVIDAEDSAYPKAVRGMKLGEIVHNMRFEALFADRSDELKAMGISLIEARSHPVEGICDALRCYYQINPPNKTIGPNFFVPEHAPYPKHVWGLALGKYVVKIRKNGYLAQYRDRFEAAGLRFDARPISS